MREFMVLVERAVRPVRASGRRKDRMREELLTHVTALYETERARLSDEQAARDAAGDPAKLSQDLQESVSIGERFSFELESLFGWRAPESAARYMFRLTAQLFLIEVILVVFLLLAVFAIEGHVGQLTLKLRLIAAFLVLSGADVFALGLLYYLMRDRLWGGLGVDRSWFQAALFAVLFGVIVLASGIAFPVIAFPGVMSFEILYPWWYLAALLSPFVPAVVGLTRGRSEIRHTEWACLEIGQ